MIKVKRKKYGMTLVELIIYVGLFATVSTLITGLLITVVRIQNRGVLSSDLGIQLSFVLDTVTRLVRESSLIESTSCNGDFCSVTLRMPNEVNDPTIVRSDANAVYLKQGSGEEDRLTSDEVVVESLDFNIDLMPGGHTILNTDLSLRANTPNPATALVRSLQSAIGRASAATFDTSLLPASGTLDIGGISNVWRNGYFSGKVGIGTTAPGGQLHLKGDGLILLEDSGSTNQWQFNSWAGGHFSVERIGLGSTSMFLDGTSGNVGIGTTSPLGRLNIEKSDSTRTTASATADALVIENNSSTGISIFTPANALGSIRFGDPSDDGAGVIVYDHSANSMKLQVNGSSTANVFLKSDGNFGVGSVNPGSKLTVTGGDVYISEISSGIILKSPDGTCARGTINNSDVLSFSSVACPTN